MLALLNFLCKQVPYDVRVKSPAKTNTDHHNGDLNYSFLLSDSDCLQ